MSQNTVDKRRLPQHTDEDSKPFPPRQPRDGGSLPAPWATALARTKKHIRTESRHKGAARRTAPKNLPRQD